MSSRLSGTLPSCENARGDGSFSRIARGGTSKREFYKGYNFPRSEVCAPSAVRNTHSVSLRSGEIPKSAKGGGAGYARRQAACERKVDLQSPCPRV